jgi:hypothetical protein
MNANVQPPLSLVGAIHHLYASDLRRFRWLVAGTIGLELLRALLVETALHFAAPTATGGVGTIAGQMAASVLDLATFLAAAFTTAVLIQADHPTDDRAFWRTRPVPPLAVAVSKTLVLLLLFVAAPSVANATRLLAYGAPLGALVASTVQIAVAAAYVCVPAGLIAILTRTLPRFLGAAAVVAVGAAIASGFYAAFWLVGIGVFRPGPWGGPSVFDWQQVGRFGWWPGLLSTVAASMVLVAYYPFRRRRFLLTALAGIIVIPALLPSPAQEQAATPDLARLVDGHLQLPQDMDSFAAGSNDPRLARFLAVTGRLSMLPLPETVSARTRLGPVRVHAGTATVDAEGDEQCCAGSGAMGLVSRVGAEAASRERSSHNDPVSGRWYGTWNLFRVPALLADALRKGSVSVEAEATVTFTRHRLVGALPIRPGASLRTDDYLIEILATERLAESVEIVLVRFARFPSLTRSAGPHLDFFESDAGRRQVTLARASWPISTYNPGTTVDHWSRGQTWVGRSYITIGPPAVTQAAELVVVESRDAGSIRTSVHARNVSIRLPEANRVR